MMDVGLQAIGRQFVELSVTIERLTQDNARLAEEARTLRDKVDQLEAAQDKEVGGA